MKLIKLIGCSLLLLSSLAFAEENKKFYLGGKTGDFKVDVDFLDSMSAKGFYGGINFDGFNSLEIETITSEKANIKVGSSTVGSAKIKSTAIYYAYRSGKPLFFKYRIGLLKEDVETSGRGGQFEGSDSGLSLGLGGGYNFGPALIEVEYTIIEADVNYLSGGLAIQF